MLDFVCFSFMLHFYLLPIISQTCSSQAVILGFFQEKMFILYASSFTQQFSRDS